MYANVAGNCAKGGRDPLAKRKKEAHTQKHLASEKGKKKNQKRNKKPERVAGASVKGFLVKLSIALRGGAITKEQYDELKEAVVDGDDADLQGAIDLRREFVSGNCTTTREQRDEQRAEKTAEKVRVKITELKVKQTKQNKAAVEDRQDNMKRVFAEMRQTQAKLAKIRTEQNALLSFALHEGKYTKAIPSQFYHKESAAHNKATAAIKHHWGAGGGGSHYNMASTKGYLKGDRIPGMVARHSKQAAIRNGLKNRSASKAI